MLTISSADKDPELELSYVSGGDAKEHTHSVHNHRKLETMQMSSSCWMINNLRYSHKMEYYLAIKKE